MLPSKVFREEVWLLTLNLRNDHFDTAGLKDIRDWGKSESKDTEVGNHGACEEQWKFCFAESPGVRGK